jgi:hypothetical protein
MLILSLLSFKVYMLVYRRVDHEEKKGSTAGEAARVQALACDSSHSTPDGRTKTQTERSIPTSMVDLVADEAAGSEAEQRRKHENLEQEADVEERSDKKMKV